MIVVLFLIISICLTSIFDESIELWCRFIRRIFQINVSTTFFHLVVVWLRARRWETVELFSTTYKIWRWSRRVFKSEYILTKIWQTINWRNAEQKSWRIYRIAWFSQSDTARASKERLFLTWIRLQIVYLLTALKITNFCQWLNWVNDDTKTKQSRLTIIVIIMNRWWVIWKMIKWKEKTKKTRFFYVFKIKITSLFTSFYELRYLRFNDIMRSIFKWQQNII
jgi:hypothetical protein